MSLKLRRGDVFCRLCKHAFRHHCIFIFVQQGDMMQNLIKPLEIVPCNGLDVMGSSMCGCIGYEPLDNLEFLEWKSQEQEHGKIIDDSSW
jgi:hypothetical protein